MFEDKRTGGGGEEGDRAHEKEERRNIKEDIQFSKHSLSWVLEITAYGHPCQAPLGKGLRLCEERKATKWAWKTQAVKPWDVGHCRGPEQNKAVIFFSQPSKQEATCGIKIAKAKLGVCVDLLVWGNWEKYKELRDLCAIRYQHHDAVV
ncbi:hypothetical protein CB1_001683039 [Camelus ferus]|nr:hypothetical protein CB1_001683039 [Camelus ferus]